MTSPTISNSQIPLKYTFLGPNGQITQPWAYWLQNLSGLTGPLSNGSGYVIDSTASITGPTKIAQGAAANRGAMPSSNAIYIAPDTGSTYTVVSGSWVEQTPAFTGDVLKDAHSTITTLANVNAVSGTFGSGSMVPVITTNHKGVITNITLTPILAPAANTSGKVGEIYYKLDAAGNIGAAANLSYDELSGNIYVSSVILFDDPVPTMSNLSPLTSKGDVFTHDGNINIRQAVGPDGYVLTADSSQITGLNWAPSGGSSTTAIEVPFNFGDATPKFLANVFANKIVMSSSILITTAFDGTNPNLSIGSAGTPDDIMGTGDNLPTIQSTWTNNPNTIYGTTTPVYLTINSGSGATTGSGLVVLNIQT